MQGRAHVVPDDIKSMAVPVLAHRLQLRGGLGAPSEGAIEALLEALVETVPVPG